MIIFKIQTRLFVLALTMFASIPRGTCAPRSDPDKPIKGDGVIDRVMATGSEPVFRADGYMFRVTSETEVRFGKGLQALSEVVPNTYAIFEGKFDDTGTIVATKASFARLKVPKSKPDPKTLQVTTFPPNSKIDADDGFAVGEKAFPEADHGGWCGWYDLHIDSAEQEHIRTIGFKLVPQYQQNLPASNPAKIPFRFYEVEEKQYRSPIFCGNGLVLVPAEVVHRLQNEGQLAAVLADGIAGALQLRADLWRGFTWKDAALGAASGAIGAAGLVGSTAALAGNLVVLHNAAHPDAHQRGRMSLAMMADAGFDPHLAPEAWKLLAPGHFPKDPAHLKYPELSLYLQSVLSEQYRVPGSPAPEPDPSHTVCVPVT